MTEPRPPGPYPISGIAMETWLVRFDKSGVCTSPKTRDAMLSNLAAKKDRPVIFFSHGWNNDFADAVDLYRRFLTEFETVLKTHPINGPPPIFVGLTWPSIWFASDAGPAMAGAGDSKAASADDAVLRELADTLPSAADRSRLYELLESEKISREEAGELARLLAPALRSGGEEGPATAAADEASIVGAMADLQRAESPPIEDDIDAIGVVGGVGGAGAGQVAAAGFFDFLDPRVAIRLASLYLMKDRAGQVGSNGVAALLRDSTQANHRARLCGRPFVWMQGHAVRGGRRPESGSKAEVDVAVAAGGIVSELCQDGAGARRTGRLSAGARPGRDPGLFDLQRVGFSAAHHLSPRFAEAERSG